MDKHTYILEEGKWKAKGIYYDVNMNEMQVYGETEIIHEDEEWLLNGFMEISESENIRVFNTYKMEPIQNLKDYMSWESENPAFGKLYGKFMFVGETILSNYESEDKEIKGCEVMIKLNDNLYTNKGFAFKGEEENFFMGSDSG